VAEHLIESLLRQPKDCLSHCLLRFIFESLGNTYMAPSWWDGLLEAQRAQLRYRMQAGADPRQRGRTGILLDDGLQVVNWEIKNTAQHLRSYSACVPIQNHVISSCSRRPTAR